jgi:hypothetical protein
MTDEKITALWEHIFQNATFPGVGDTTGLRGSTVAGYFYYALHTADPKEFDDAEVIYTGYARVAVARSATGFTVAGNMAYNYADIQFPERTNVGATVVALYFGIHTASSGVNNLFASAQLIIPLSIVKGVLPPYGPGNLVVEINRV